MRPPSHQSMVGGRIVFAVLSLLISWQLHITAAGMNVPWPVLGAVGGGLAVAALTMRSRSLLLSSAIAAQFAVHYGASLPIFDHACHSTMTDTGTFLMILAHSVAAIAGWLLLVFAEDFVGIAFAMLERVVQLFARVVAPRISTIRILGDFQRLPLNRFTSSIWSRGPPLNA